MTFPRSRGPELPESRLQFVTEARSRRTGSKGQDVGGAEWQDAHTGPQRRSKGKRLVMNNVKKKDELTKSSTRVRVEGVDEDRGVLVVLGKQD